MERDRRNNSVDMEMMRDRLLRDGVIVHNGNTYKVNPWLKRKGRTLGEYFESHMGEFGDFPVNAPYEETVYRIINGIAETPLCPLCGRPRHLTDFYSGYAKTCEARECVSRLRAQTNMERYGTSSPMGSEKVREKARKTSLERYGVEDYTMTPEYREKARRTCLEKYGLLSHTQSEKVREKARNTCMEKYGAPSYVQTEEFRLKVMESSMSRYGVDNYSRLNECRDKVASTCMERYGVPHVLQNPSIHAKALGGRKASAPENRLAECLTNRGIEFRREYICNGKSFDFAVFRNGELVTLVEIDGEYHHGLMEDCNDLHVKGYNDESRFLKVPEGVRFVVCDSMRIEECLDEVLSSLDVSYDDWIGGIMSSLPEEFPYPVYDEERMRKDYRHLCDWSEFKPKSRVGDSTIRNFHKSIYTAHVGHKPSPVEAWGNRRLLEKCVRNRFIYSSNLSSQSIADGFNVCRLAPKVSVFSAPLAKTLTLRYLRDYDVVFDPFSGFSGRMLGVCASGRRYVGQDISETAVTESLMIRDFHNLDAEVSRADVLESHGEYPCLLTCSPYGMKENWNNEGQKNMSCDEWVDVCLRNFHCGRYVFVVDGTEKYRQFVVEEIRNISHFGENREYVLSIPGSFAWSPRY